MNYETDWWGITLYAETEEDKALLSKLNDSIKDKEPIDNYEGGEIGFTDSKLVLNR